MIHLDISGNSSDLRPDQQKAIEAGGFSGDEVWVEFLTQRDNRVRPAHAALHGTFWRVDDPAAPTPPLDYGCRCQLRYVAKPGTLAALVFPTAEGEPVPVARAYASYLDKHLPRWREVADVAEKAEPARRFSAAYLKLKELHPALGGDTRDLARMAVQADATGPAPVLPPRPLPPPPPEPGPGPAPVPPVPPVPPAPPAPATTAAEAVERLAGLKDAPVDAQRAVLRVEDPATFAAQVATPRDPRRRARLQEGLAEYRQMVSDKLLPKAVVQVETIRTRRSYARGSAAYMSAQAGPRTVIHELGHVLEHLNPEVADKARAFLARRTAGEESRKLRDLTGIRAYGPGEMAKRDKFLDPYMGKIYPHGATEIVSMGMEWMWVDPAAFAARDPDYFTFIFDLLRGR